MGSAMNAHHEFARYASESTKIPDRLFIFELANNHMGNVEHGIRVIREFRGVAKDFDFKFAFKLQYRQLDSFIHEDFKDRLDIKYIKRFSETRLSREDMKRIVGEIRDAGFLAICTPFDEASVDAIVEDQFDVLKVASCSFTDWPLLEKIASSSLSVIASTAGISQDNMDNVVAFMLHRNKDFLLMHCVAEYPTPAAGLQLNQIDYLQRRYPNIRIGYSTHESPDETVAVAMAIAKGAVAFEKHVGVVTEEYALNNYSATPKQVHAWLKSAQHAYDVAGRTAGRIEPTKAELDSLISLRRGAFVNRDIEAGERIRPSDVFFAIPTQEGHVTANDWSKYSHYYATSPIKAKQAVLQSNARYENVRERVSAVVQRVKDLLTEARVVVPGQADLEISHHYGLEKFDEFGITMITVVNRDYCKKIIAVLPGQKHPEQYHNLKEETFHILHGDLTLSLNGKSQVYGVGAVITIEPGVRHAFESATGAVFEEISSTHMGSDSYYTDEEIGKNPERKTFLTHWMV